MNRFFLYAVAITALCSSCETEDETFATETKNQPNALYHAKGIEANDYQTYQSILNSFVYNNEQTYQNNLLLFEAHVNRLMLQYMHQETDGYKKINTEQLLMLQQADTNYIEKLAYTEETKQAIYALVSNQFNSETARLLTNQKERRLVETLVALHNNGNGDDNDGKLNGKRTIAFAYGAQYSFTQAVLYAGAIELSTKQ